MQEFEIQALEAEISALKNGAVTLNEDNITPELARLRTENSKFKYQCMHLKRVGRAFVRIKYPVVSLHLKQVDHEVYRYVRLGYLCMQLKQAVGIYVYLKQEDGR